MKGSSTVQLPVSRDSSSDDCFRLAKHWLGECLRSHSLKCAMSKTQLPTRVIDVGSLGSTQLYLYVAQGEIGQWLTLSHCWGKRVPAQTLVSNLKTRCEGFSIFDLPQTFQDAVSITQRLGYRYLWIDSLCIIQDSPSDWQAESAKMSRIYANAVLNISADASRNSYQGIFKSANEKRPHQLLLPAYSARHGIRSDLFAEVAEHPDPDESLLQKRAWVLQETLLSRRRLRYTQWKLFWSCNTVYSACHESDPDMINSPENTFSIESRKKPSSIGSIPYKLLAPKIDLGWGAGVTQVDSLSMLWWYKLVDNYIQRSISFRKDRFPALVGVVEEFSKRTGYHYMTGLWQEDFRRGLVWNGHGARLDLNGFPSWSWAAIDEFLDPNLERPYEHIAYLMRYTESREAQLVDSSILLAWRNGSANLWLQGLCKSLKQMKMTKGLYFQRSEYWAEIVTDVRGKLSLGGTEWSGRVYMAARISLDGMFDESSLQRLFDNEDILAIQIAQFEGNPHSIMIKTIYALIIEPNGGPENIYKRIGIFALPRQETSMVGWKNQRVIII
jgi:hypothetical protein